MSLEYLFAHYYQSVFVNNLASSRKWFTNFGGNYKCLRYDDFKLCMPRILACLVRSFISSVTEVQETSL